MTAARMPAEALTALVAANDKDIGDVLAPRLRADGYAVDLAPDVEAAVACLKSCQYTVALVDWRMPRQLALDLVHRLRGCGTSTVLLLASQDTAADRLAGLDAGADDYLVLPFDLRELLARLRALHRPLPVSRSHRLVLGEIEVDPSARRALVRGHQLPLTSIELGILEILLRQSPSLVDRRVIAQHFWGNEADAFGLNIIDAHLARLRSKLTGSGVRIETVGGFGDRIMPMPESP